MFLHCRHQRFLDFAASPFEVTAELPSELQDILVKLRKSQWETASDPFRSIMFWRVWKSGNKARALVLVSSSVAHAWPSGHSEALPVLLQSMALPSLYQSNDWPLLLQAAWERPEFLSHDSERDQPRKTFLSHKMRPRSHSGVGTLTYFPSWREAHSYTYYCTLDDSMPLLPRCEENVKPRSASADTARQAMNSLSFGSMIDTKTWG